MKKYCRKTFQNKFTIIIKCVLSRLPRIDRSRINQSHYFVFKNIFNELLRVCANRVPTVCQACVRQPCVNRVPTVRQPCANRVFANRAPTVRQPCANRASTVCQLTCANGAWCANRVSIVCQVCAKRASTVCGRCNGILPNCRNYYQVINNTNAIIMIIDY